MQVMQDRLYGHYIPGRTQEGVGGAGRSSRLWTEANSDIRGGLLTQLIPLFKTKSKSTVWW